MYDIGSVCLNCSKCRCPFRLLSGLFVNRLTESSFVTREERADFPGHLPPDFILVSVLFLRYSSVERSRCSTGGLHHGRCIA